METKSTPPAVVLSITVLVLITICGLSYSSIWLATWQWRHEDILPFTALRGAFVYCVLPVLAIHELILRRGTGRFLAIASMLVSWLAMFVNLFPLPRGFFQRAESAIFIPIFGSLVWLPMLIYFLGFNRRVKAYFIS